jgi:hypothetical protein
MKGPTVPIRRLALVPFALMAVGLSACSIITGDTGQEGPSSDPVEEPSTESAAPTEPSSETAVDPSETAVDLSLQVEAEKVATAAEDALEPVIGSRPDIDCGELDHHVYVDREIYCTLIDPANGDEYEVKMTVTSIEGETFNFDIEVADTPK